MERTGVILLRHGLRSGANRAFVVHCKDRYTINKGADELVAFGMDDYGHSANDTSDKGWLV